MTSVRSIMNNSAMYEFSVEDLTFNTYEKIFIVLIWLIIQIPGNIMLLGLIQFDRHGNDPCKRRIHDQVCKIRFSNNEPTLDTIF